MNVLELPFNHFIGLQKSDKIEYLFMLTDKAEYKNHLQTVHASALFALSEATSGKFLFDEFSEISGVIPVVRSVNVRYRKLAIGNVYSKAAFDNIAKENIYEKIKNKQRVLINVVVSLFDNEENKVMQSDFEWFIAYK